jgi:uncharacterized membrane protein
MPQGSKVSQREEIIDIARGFAMIFVCLSHFTTAYVQSQVGMSTAQSLWVIGMIASPTFMLLSGTLLGVEFGRRPHAFAQFRVKLADRALFLIVVGHVLMLLSGLPRKAESPSFFMSTFITDAIAFSLLIAPWIVPRLTRRERVVLAAAVISVSWLIIDDWQPHHPVEVALKAILFGDVNRSWFPLIPWFGFYLASTVFGEHLATYLRQRAYSKVTASMLGLGVSFIAGSVVLRAVRWAAVHGFISPLHSSRGLLMLTSQSQKYPPGPAYILFFAGAGACLIAVLCEMWRRGIAARVLRLFAAIGQSSLFVFVLQAHLYFVVLYYVHLPSVRAWPVVFLLTLVPLVSAAWWWSQRRLNKYLTVGLPTLLTALSARRGAFLRTEG